MVGSFAPGSIASLDLTALTYSVAVAEHLGFRQAAAALGVNQSVLSRRVQALEDQLQVALFERGSRGSRLTSAGERFLPEARAALSDIDHAAAAARANGRGEEGRLHLGFYTPLSGGFLRELVRRYRTDHPHVAVELREECRRTLLTLTRQRRLDVAFVIGSGGAGGCDTAELWSEPVFVTLPDSHRLADSAEVSWADLEGERFLATEAECGAEVHDHVVRHMTGLGHRPEVERIAVGRDSLLNLIAMGFGVSLAGEAGAALPVPGVVFRPLTSPTDVVTFYAAWSPENANPALRQFISLAHVLAGRPRKGTSDWTGRAA